MEYKTLGKTGLKVSRMGFGGIPIQKIDEEGTKKLLQDMVKRGINYIDSARGYTCLLYTSDAADDTASV